MKKFKLALHIFRRDLRLEDNTALIEALKNSDLVIPCFIFDKRQIEHNDYKGNPSIQFMVTSLLELDQVLQRHQSKLYIFYGKAEEIVEQLLTEMPIDAVFINRDYTPFSLNRDKAIQMICKTRSVNYFCCADALLHEPEDILKSNNTPYTIFTPYVHQAKLHTIQKPYKNKYTNYYRDNIAFVDSQILQKLSRISNPALLVKGGRSEGLLLLKRVPNLADYQTIRNFPALSGTTKLSAHNKFGTISIREFYATIVKYLDEGHMLINELYWRDFFTHIGFHFPRVFGHAYHEKYDHLKWNHNDKHFHAWCTGNTGFPIVDAGMRELNTTGYMHNRVRMIAASFLTKDLHIDWRLGEKYFAQKLTDYDPAVNNGNWQWAASTGCDAQPYFRIFNPWLQQQKYDSECLYIKRFIPELARIPIALIHHPEKIVSIRTNYSAPIVDHEVEIQKSKFIYKNIKPEEYR